MQKTVPPLFIAFSNWYGYQLKNAIKSGGTVFCIYHLGYQGPVDAKWSQIEPEPQIKNKQTKLDIPKH